MNDLSLFILDLCQNSISAMARNIKITINEMINDNKLIIEIVDDGKGIEDEKINEVFDPFYTTRTTRKVGLGLPLFKEMVSLANGEVRLTSSKKMTILTSIMEYYHVDRLDIGDMSETILSLLINENIDIEFIYIVNKNIYSFSTIEIKKVLDGVSIKEKEIFSWIKNNLEKGIENVKVGGY